MLHQNLGDIGKSIAQEISWPLRDFPRAVLEGNLEGPDFPILFCQKADGICLFAFSTCFRFEAFFAAISLLKIHSSSKEWLQRGSNLGPRENFPLVFSWKIYSPASAALSILLSLPQSCLVSLIIFCREKKLIISWDSSLKIETLVNYCSHHHHHHHCHP